MPWKHLWAENRIWMRSGPQIGKDQSNDIKVFMSRKLEETVFCPKRKLDQDSSITIQESISSHKQNVTDVHKARKTSEGNFGFRIISPKRRAAVANERNRTGLMWTQASESNRAWAIKRMWNEWKVPKYCEKKSMVKSHPLSSQKQSYQRMSDFAPHPPKAELSTYEWFGTTLLKSRSIHGWLISAFP